MPESLPIQPGNWSSVNDYLLGNTPTVKGFGAKGDGITDDTAAILSAINAAGQHATVFFPDGTYVCALGTLGTTTALGGRSIRFVGRNPYTTLLKPLNQTQPLFTIQGSGDKADDLFEMQNLGITAASSRNYDKPIIDIRLVRGWRIHNCRADLDTLNAGTVFKISSAYEGGFSNTKLRTGKFVVPVEFVNDQELPSTPGVAPQVDTVSFAGLTVIGVLPVTVRNAPAGGVTGNEIHGLDFTKFKHVATTFYPAANSPLYETTLSSPTNAGDSSFTVASVGTPGSAQTGITVGDVVTIGFNETIDFAQVTAINTNTITCHALGPLVRAHSSGEPVIVGGMNISLGSNIHAVTLGAGFHVEGNLVGVQVGAVQVITGISVYNGSGELFRIVDNAQRIHLLSLYTRGTTAKHNIFWRPSYAVSANDGDWTIDHMHVDSGAPIAAPTVIPHTTRAWKTPGSGNPSSTNPQEILNANSAGNAKRLIMQNNGAEVYSLMWSGQVRATDGVRTKYVSGAGKTTVSDGDFTATPADGTMAIHRDTTGAKDYISVRSNGVWKVMAGPL